MKQKSKRKEEEMGDIAARPETAPAPQDDRNVFEVYADAMSRQRIVGDLLKFSKGDWLSGRDGDLVEEGTELVAGCDGVEIGWTKWRDFKPVEFAMGLLAQGFRLARRQDLDEQDELHWPRDEATGQPRDPWQLSNTIVMMDPETRQLFTFAAASKGAIGAMGKLLGIYGKHVRQAPEMLPVVALLSDSYKHSNRAFGIIKFPVLKVTRWVPRVEFDAALAGAHDEEAGEAAEPEEEVPPPPKAKPSPHKDYAAVKGRPRRARRHPDEDDVDVPF